MVLRSWTLWRKRAVVQTVGQRDSCRHGVQPFPAATPTAFPKACLAQDPSGSGSRKDGDTIVGFAVQLDGQTILVHCHALVRSDAQARASGRLFFEKPEQAGANGGQ